MDWRYTTYALLSFVVATFLILSAFYAWRRRGAPGATALAVLMVAGAVWWVAYTLSLGSADPPMRLFLGKVEYLGIVVVPLAWLTFALQYTGRESWVTRRVLALLAIEPLITLVLDFSNSDLFLSSRATSTTIESDHGPWYWIHISYSFLLLLVGTFFLVQALASSRHLYRGQRLSLVTGILVPWVGNAFLNVSDLVPAGSLDPTPVAFALPGVAFAWALFRYGPLDVVPVARNAVVEGMRDGVIVLDAQDRIVDLNPAARRILGCSFHEAFGRPFSQIMPGQIALLGHHRESEEALGEATLGGEPASRDYDLAFSLLRTRSGSRVGQLISLRDVTERKRAERTLRESEERFRTVVQSLGEGLLTTDVDDVVLYANPRMTELTGYAEEEMLGRSVHELLVPTEQWPNTVRRNEWRVRGSADRYEMRLKRKDGEFFWAEVNAAPYRDAAGEIVGTLGAVTDITERKALEDRLVYQALHDPLTGLPNRILFMNRLELALARAKRRGGKRLVVLFVDLDNFKFVNDTLGHEAGDELLIAVSGRLRACLRPGDTVARLGGDEFAALLEDVADAREATRVAERIVEELRAPFALDSQETFITPSIGIAFGRPGRDLPETLLCNADIAMYRAKEEGKARHRVFDPGMEAEVTGRLRLENGLRRALERDEFKVCYQPVVHLETGQIVAFEALVRWEHPERGLVSPEEFVPLAEEIGLIIPIGRWVLLSACRQAKEWQERYPLGPPLDIGVNLSARQLQHPELVEDVGEVLRETGLDPERLVLEITEGAVIGEGEHYIDVLRRLRNLGVRFAIDDFGTGYSSLSYLKRLPVGLLKIDASFVEKIGEDAEDEVLVSGMVHVASGLGLGVLAEGVETPEQLAWVKDLGCDLVQGNYFSEPLFGEAAGELLATYDYRRWRGLGLG